MRVLLKTVFQRTAFSVTAPSRGRKDALKMYEFGNHVIFKYFTSWLTAKRLNEKLYYIYFTGRKLEDTCLLIV